MHLTEIELFPEKYPTTDFYPFNQPIFQRTRRLKITAPVCFFIGENGSGKSTLLEAIAHKSSIHIWRNDNGRRYVNNPFESAMYQFLKIQWTNGSVPGSFFGADIFRHFVESLDDWAVADEQMLKYFGGKSLMTQSHGQSLMSFFRARYQIKGLYLMDEPETALSPKTQLELLNLLAEVSRAGHAQFIIVTHSPILMACPDAQIFDFNQIPISETVYNQTEHYRLYRQFMEDPGHFLKN